jgi:hypothetical protein
LKRSQIVIGRGLSNLTARLKNSPQLKSNCVVQLKTTMFCAGANRFLIDHCLHSQASSAP